MLILMGSVDTNFLVSIVQAALAVSVVSIAICNSEEIHNRIWLYAVLLGLVHVLINCVSGTVPMHWMPVMIVAFGLFWVGRTSVPRILVYRPQSLLWCLQNQVGWPKQLQGVYSLTGTIGNEKTMLTFHSPKTLRRPLASKTVSDWIIW